MTADDFVEADRVYANPHRTVITATKEQSAELKNLIASLKEAKDEDEEDKEISKRLASLTSGMVTVKVGGSTPIEVREKIYRYEDAINATRSALKDGYLVGGGLAMLNAYDDDFPEETKDIAKKLSQASIRQIAKNCGAHEDYVVSNCSGDVGYNAKEDAFANLLDVGVIDPYKVTEMAIKNAVSVANSVLTAGWVIVNQKEKKKYEESRTSE
jgi:chaperonin GroEL